MNNWKKTFTIIWIGQFMSILSSAIVGFAVILWLSFETGSAEVLALSTLAALLPQALLGPVAGVYIDRWDRKKVMIAADSFIALCTMLLAILFYFDMAQIWHIYLMLAMRSVGSAFHTPAMQASVPLLAPEKALTRVAGVNQMIASIGNIAGPALGALLITFMDFGWVLMLDVIGAAFACIALLFVKIPNPEKKESEERHLWNEMKEGLQAMMAQKGIWILFLFSILSTFCIMPVSALFPLMTLKHFLGNAYQMSLVEVVWGVGMLVGGAAMGFWKGNINKVFLIVLSDTVIGLTFALTGLLPSNGFIMFVILTGISGIMATMYWSSFTALLQEKIEPSKLGRVYSLYSSASLLPSMLGLVFAGAVADNIGLSVTFFICGLVIMLSGIGAWCMPMVRKMGK